MSLRQTLAAALGFLAVVALGAGAATPLAGATSEVERPADEHRADLAQIEAEVMCPICGTLLELSGAPAADRQRAFIRTMIEDGATEEEIKDALVAEYGPDVLAVPEASGFGLAAWVLPGAGIGLAALLIGLAVRRWHAARPAAEQPGARPAGLDAEQSRRLEEDMELHDDE